MGTLERFSTEEDERPRKFSKLSDDPEEEDAMQIDMGSLLASQDQGNINLIQQQSIIPRDSYFF